MFLFTAAAAVAQIAHPRAGYIVDRKGALRPIEGVAGAFTVGAAIDRDVVSASFSGKTLIVKKDRSLLVDGKSFDAPSGPAAVTFLPDGRLREVFFPEPGILWTWIGDKFEEVPAAGIQEDFEVRDGRLTTRGVPVKLSSAVNRISRMGEDWLVAYAGNRIYAIRNGEAVELPEDEE